MNEEPFIDPEGERRLREAGFEPEGGPAGERWRHPYTGRLVPGGLALARVAHQEEGTAPVGIGRERFLARLLGMPRPGPVTVSHFSPKGRPEVP